MSLMISFFNMFNLNIINLPVTHLFLCGDNWHDFVREKQLSAYKSQNRNTDCKHAYIYLF